MNPCSIDIKDILAEHSSLGLVFGQNLHIGREPVNPPNCVTIYDPPGGRIADTANTRDEKYYYLPLQIRVRDVSYTNGMQLAKDIENILHGIHNQTINETYYAFIRCNVPPFVLTWDENNRVIIIINFLIQRR